MPRHCRVAISAGAACLALLAHAAAGRANEPGRIAFDHIATDGVEDIWSIRPDGSDLTKITTTPAGQGGSEAPEWGPFGQRVLFDTDPEFSPDGKTIAFLRVLSLVAPTAESAVFVIGRDGRGLKQLTPYSLNARGPRWSPDGRRLIFSSNDDNNNFDHPADLYVVNADGRGLTQLTHEPLGSDSFTPDWSPDGTQIAYTHYSPGEGAVVSIMDLASRRSHVIWHSSLHTIDWDLAWEREPGRRDGEVWW